MSESAIQSKLNSIFQMVFDKPDFEFDRDSSAFDIEEWDSLSHIRLIVAIEKAFRIRIAPNEAEHLDNFGVILDAIEQKSR